MTTVTEIKLRNKIIVDSSIDNIIHKIDTLDDYQLQMILDFVLTEQKRRKEKEATL